MNCPRLLFATLLITPCFSAEPLSLPDALARGKVSLNARLRYEEVSQTGLRDASALTLRTRLGYTTAAINGWKAMLEAENITAADGDSYSQSGLNPGGAGRAVIPDPETTEINQAFVAYETGKTALTLGRQRIAFDSARFIGDVGWRQNNQTFDAVFLQNKDLAKTTLSYAFLHQINRVVGDRHPQGDWESASHCFNASYEGLPAGKLTGYAYLLDFANAAANSCASYGVLFSGSAPLADGAKLLYQAEVALQSDYGSSALNYDARYYAVEAGVGVKPGSLSVGYEVLGSDNNVGFKTPLATLHAFNGWADLFLSTPAGGLRDSYVKASANLPEAFVLVAHYHRYKLDSNGTDAGREFNAQLSRKFGKSVTALVKYADYQRKSLLFPDVRKAWLQVEFSY